MGVIVGDPENPFAEIVTVAANGVEYEGWESVIVVWDFEAPYVSFQLSTTEIGGPKDKGTPFDKWNFPPGTPITIMATGDPLVSGVVNVYAPQVSPDQHSITVTGVTYGKDFADSSVRHPTGNFENKTDLAILDELAAGAGVSISKFAEAMLIPKFQIRQGATNYAEVMRLLQQRGKMLTSMLPDGQLAAVGGGREFSITTTGALVQGENILKCSARLTDEAFFTYEAIGQHVDEDYINSLEPYGIALDVTRRANRYKKIIDQGISTPELAQLRANWERARSLGATTQATIVTPGWRDGARKFWQPNSDIYVYAPWLKIDCWLRTYRIVWEKSLANGTITTITLIDPIGIGGESAACNSSSIWTVPWKGGGD